VYTKQLHSTKKQTLRAADCRARSHKGKWAMVRPALLIQRTVFLSVNNPLMNMADTQAWVQQLSARATATSVTGMVLAGCDRWLCLLEGEPSQVESMVQAVQRHIRPKEWHVVMTNTRAKGRLFPHRPIVWRMDCSMLEMAFFLSDLRHCKSRSQTWHVNAHALTALLEPAA
jgi:Sensors of blue-light using FAD